MRGVIFQILGMIISGILFMPISIKFGWSKKLWAFLNRKINKKYNTVFWLVFVCTFNILIEMFLESMGAAHSDIISGFVLGFSLVFMPNLK